MLFYPYNIIYCFHVFCAEFAANDRRLYILSLASINSYFLPVFQFYKIHFS